MASRTEPQQQQQQQLELSPRPLQQDSRESQQRSPQLEHPEQRQRPKSLAKACVACRAKKIRCDAGRPRCSPCASQGRECVYRSEAPRQRPTFSRINELQREQAALKAFIVKLKQSSPADREALLASAVDEDGTVNLSPVPGQSYPPDHQVSKQPPTRRPREGATETPIISTDDELDIAHFISVDDAGKPSSFGPSSALHNPARSEPGLSPSRQSTTQENARNTLIANAALQRHLEYGLARLPNIDGIATELAFHLLNLHWARQHHTFLLTYRPAVMRDLQCSGPYCSSFLLNAIFACSSKFSPRTELRDNPNDAATAGRRFFRRCDEILAKESLLTRPHISTIVGLLLLGSTYNARGETSKGWLYTGYALRMVYDLGLHLDPKQTTDNAEEIEIRRRVFWGAFVSDKLQSLYLGRPVAINLRDSQVTREFLDLYEEKEPFLPPALLTASSPRLPEGMGDAIPLHSVSTFQQLCLLSKIMTTIINRFYVVGATFSNAQSSLLQVDKALQQWKENLSPDLDFQPWRSPDVPTLRQTPNVMVLHNLYHSLIILVHRPFISDGHLRSAAAPIRSWERCTAAARCITSIALAYKSAFGLAGAPYVLGYTIYVACTIHVRNAATREHQLGDHLSLLNASLRCLDELCLPNPGVAKPANIIRRLIELNKLDLGTGHSGTCATQTNDADGFIEEMLPMMDQSSINFDLDAILNMFPVSHGADTDFAKSSFRLAPDYELPPDPLFGLMDGPGISFDLETPSMPM
ncbi:fungal-specific transcription factor domain-containing protein [Thelonectria olida]|uniref:Fungal-specific transcription factor domain-containing protein n=1 Tax=Thelonectria olida TaxID=1576542 RepID=A0A9P8VNX0_9HYPO|nr:fungal-specific transcription factor domain-containing protein [Thelonectria olida]